MQNEKRKGQHWKDKLEEAGSFPYSSANKELSWQKLSTRLGEKRRRKSVLYYWVAAACLLPFIVYLFSLQTSGPQASVARTHHQTTIPKAITDKSKAQTEIAVVRTSTYQPSVHKTGIQKNSQSDSVVKIEKKQSDSVIDSVTANSAIAKVVTTDSNTNTIAVAPTQKKKLKVVHINELNEPDPGVPVMAHNSHYPTFLPLHIASESIFPEPEKARIQTGVIYLKKKSSN